MQVLLSLKFVLQSKLQEFLPKNIYKVIVKNVLFELAKTISKVYPNAHIDYPDRSKNTKKSKFKNVKFGNNVLIGKNVKIGSNSIIGSNTIIEHEVEIGNNCVIGHGNFIKNSIIGNNVVIQDNTKLVKKVWFIPLKDKNLKFPHIGSF